MKILKKITHFIGAIAFMVLSIAFIRIVLELNPKWMAWVFWISFGIWVILNAYIDGRRYYRKRIKPIVDNVNDVMDLTAGLSEQFHHEGSEKERPDNQ